MFDNQPPLRLPCPVCRSEIPVAWVMKISGRREHNSWEPNSEPVCPNGHDLIVRGYSLVEK